MVLRSILAALIAVVPSGALAQTPAPSPHPTRAVSPEDRVVTAHTYDEERLNTAVLETMNGERGKNNLPPIRAEPEASRAAALQSAFMAGFRTVTHHNSAVPELATLEARLGDFRARWSFAAENVGQVVPLAGKERSEPPQPGIVQTLDPATAKPLSYRQTARDIVNLWMTSRGHRENILAREASGAGVSCKAGELLLEAPVIYCAAVFLGLPRVRDR